MAVMAEGCGRIKRKCHIWADQLKRKRCSLLILVHDLDNNDLEDLKTRIRNALNPCPITVHLICIPVQEFEAWLLSDPNAIKNALHLKKTPRVRWLPETISSPKEHLDAHSGDVRPRHDEAVHQRALGDQPRLDQGHQDRPG